MLISFLRYSQQKMRQKDCVYCLAMIPETRKKLCFQIQLVTLSHIVPAWLTTTKQFEKSFSSDLSGIASTETTNLLDIPKSLNLLKLKIYVKVNSVT